jgi:hypothetical protein
VPAVTLATIAVIARIEDPKSFFSVGVNRRRLDRWWWEASLHLDNGGAGHTAIVGFCESLDAVLGAGEWSSDRASSWSLARFRLQPRRVRQGAQAKALCALLRRRKPRDFKAWQSRAVGAPLDLHHIFPRKWLKAHGLLREGDCFANLTLIDQSTNREFIRGQSPPEYVAALVDANGGSAEARRRLEEILVDHGIDINHLEKADPNDFGAFLDSRERWFDEVLARLGDEL